MIQLYPEYLLLSRCKTLTGSPDPTRANGTNEPCNVPNTVVAEEAEGYSWFCNQVYTVQVRLILLHLV